MIWKHAFLWNKTFWYLKISSLSHSFENAFCKYFFGIIIINFWLKVVSSMIFEYIAFFQFDLKTVRSQTMQIFWNNKYFCFWLKLVYNMLFEHIFEHIAFFQFDLKAVRSHNMQIFWNNKHLVAVSASLRLSDLLWDGGVVIWSNGIISNF